MAKTRKGVSLKTRRGTVKLKKSIRTKRTSSNSRRTSVGFFLDDSLLAKIDVKANKQGLNRSQFLRQTISAQV